MCGKIKAYMLGGLAAFFNLFDGFTSINEAYFDGVVLLYKTPSSGSGHI